MKKKKYENIATKSDVLTFIFQVYLMQHITQTRRYTKPFSFESPGNYYVNIILVFFILSCDLYIFFCFKNSQISFC